jgi:hypothetical protein
MDWRELPGFNPPSLQSGELDSSEDLLMPFWRPELQKASPDNLKVMRVVAYAEGKTTFDLVDALQDRHFYFATDDIYLLARCDKRVPGEIFQTSRKPTINVTVLGTDKLSKVEIWQDETLVKSEEPPGNAAVLEYVNANPDRKWHSYTIRILQADGAQAVAQPFWIRYLP